MQQIYLIKLAIVLMQVSGHENAIKINLLVLKIGFNFFMQTKFVIFWVEIWPFCCLVHWNVDGGVNSSLTSLLKAVVLLQLKTAPRLNISLMISQFTPTGV